MKASETKEYLDMKDKKSKDYIEGYIQGFNDAIKGRKNKEKKTVGGC